MKIELTDITIKRLGETLIDNLSITLENKKLAGILGNNAHTCSNLLKTIAGIIAPNKGTVKIDGTDMYIESPESERHRKSNSYIFKSGGLISNINIQENLFLPLIYQFPGSTADENMEIIRKYFAIFELDEILLSKRPVNITEMQQKLIIIIRALITEPELLFIDNPFVNLNLKYQEILYLFIDEFLKSENRYVIYSSATDVPFIKRSDYLLIFDGGKLLGHGLPVDLKSDHEKELEKLLNEYYKIAV